MKKAIRIIANVFAWIILIFAFLVTIVVFTSGKNNGVANLLGYIPLTVESDSMKPTFAKDDLIICKEIDDVKSLKENDVITFWTIIDGRRVKNTHRIVTINADGTYITRGDNNPVDDSLSVAPADIIGKWTNVKIKGFGKVMSFVRTKKGFFICILVPMAIFFLIELYKFIVTLIEAKRPAPAEIDEEEIKRRAVEEYLAAQKSKSGDGGDGGDGGDPKPEAEGTADKAAETEEKAPEAPAEEEAPEAPAEEAAEPETVPEGSAEETNEKMTEQV